MSEQRAVKLLWADDDAEDSMAPLGRLLVRHGFVLLKAKDYESAVELLNSEEGIDAFLADIILPHSEGIGALNYRLGISLAELAAERGVKAVAFLTVVQLPEVSVVYRELKAKYPQVSFTYFDKTRLLEANTIYILAESLKQRKD